jgi:hypothetical protein
MPRRADVGVVADATDVRDRDCGDKSLEDSSEGALEAGMVDRLR